MLSRHSLRPKGQHGVEGDPWVARACQAHRCATAPLPKARQAHSRLRRTLAGGIRLLGLLGLLGLLRPPESPMLLRCPRVVRSAAVHRPCCPTASARSSPPDDPTEPCGCQDAWVPSGRSGQTKSYPGPISKNRALKRCCCWTGCSGVGIEELRRWAGCGVSPGRPEDMRHHGHLGLTLVRPRMLSHAAQRAWRWAEQPLDYLSSTRIICSQDDRNDCIAARPDFLLCNSRQWSSIRKWN
jgi:hypothetical protein